MGKYNDWTRGEEEAILNMIGGTDIARAVLRGERKLTVESVVQSMPTEITLGGRPYEILPFLRGEKSVKGDVMVDRAKKMNANLGKEECEHLLKHANEIPVALRSKVAFVFTGWRLPGYSEYVACVFWRGDCWIQNWLWLDYDWLDGGRVLRRKSAR